MPLSHEEHEELLNTMNNPELSAEDRTEALTALRNGHTNTLSEFEELSTSNEKLTKSNDDLTRANAKLFNETGYRFRDGEDPSSNEEPEPSVPETIRLEAMGTKYKQIETQNYSMKPDIVPVTGKHHHPTKNRNHPYLRLSRSRIWKPNTGNTNLT